MTNKGGGTGILIRSGFKYESVNSPDNLEKMEITLIKVLVNDGLSIHCGAICQVTFSAEDLEKIITLIEFNNVNQSFILGGDWNCRHEQWFNEKSNPNGVKLKRWLDDRSNHFKARMLHSMVPTYLNSFIDFFLVHQKLKVLFPPNHCDQYLRAFEPGISDQSSRTDSEPEFRGRSPAFCARAESKTVFSYKSADWESLRRSVNSQLSDYHIPNYRNLNETEIDVSLNELSEIILKAMNESIPKFAMGNLKQVDLPPAIKKILNKKRSLSAKLDKAFVSTGSKQSKI